jgi:heptosyltransferase-1
VHAVQRNRWLAAAAFDYPSTCRSITGSRRRRSTPLAQCQGGLVILLTATSRDDKLWDERHWCELAEALLERGLTPVLPAGNALERQRAERIAAAGCREPLSRRRCACRRWLP